MLAIRVEYSCGAPRFVSSISAGLWLLVQQTVQLGVDGLVVGVELKQLLCLAQDLGQVLEHGVHDVVLKVRLLERRVHALALFEEARYKEMERLDSANLQPADGQPGSENRAPTKATSSSASEKGV